MNITKINVPPGIRYISDWKEFKLPNFPHILDKQIPGCGFTEWSLTNEENVVLCSPRKILLQNKSEQHLGDVFYVVNDYERIIDSGKDLTKINKKRKLNRFLLKDETKDEEAKKKFFKELTGKIGNYIKSRQGLGLPIKILVTYDSFHLVKSILLNFNLLRDFRIIIDEFQSIFVDSRFKATAEMKFVNQLQDLQRVCFVSATPMMENYLVRLDEFKHLPYFELDWEAEHPGRVIKPDLKIRSSKSVFTTAREIIEKYKNGQYEKAYRIGSNGKAECVESKEAVFYVNSVNNILSIIKRNNLKADEVNILCANTPENQKRIKTKLGAKNGFIIGRVPLRGEQHKTFTFCTRTVYLGADFYSTNARTFIISDANIDTLAVDISLDLPQILGRQRLDENPWKNSATFYYKALANGRKYTKDDFDQVIKSKLKMTQDLLDAYTDTRENAKESLVITYNNVARDYNYLENYVAVDEVYIPELNKKTKIPVQNNLVLIAEQRAYDIQQIDYADRFTVFSAVNQQFKDQEVHIKTQEFFAIYNSIVNLFDKLKYLCECDLEKEFIEGYILPNITEKHFREYYTVIGPDRCRSLGYNFSKINKELNIVSFSLTILQKEVLKIFKVGDKIAKNQIKEMLSKIYLNLGYRLTPKASDLEQYFNLRAIKVKDSSGKWVHGFEIIKKKGD